MVSIGDPPSPGAAGRASGALDDGARPEADRPYVLVVDDSAEMRTLLRDVLEPRGSTPRSPPRGGHALTLMSQRVPDLVITDLMMPGMSGFSLRSLMLRRAPTSRRCR